MEKYCCDDDCPEKNKTHPVNSLPCAKNCACYVSQTVADLKTDVVVCIYIFMNWIVKMC